ncbi:DNA polymerase-3 subunit chi [Litorivivens lipolytica]|uniref:DNA polymerase-3 subunit chi n=1 Tax=Litorivivens lipolytica TaxID=1524264 RepID=A0A7W4W3P9_9GAMM|nr:DNA polymerase III subunit chi [Litorivivens lipolytica]MBB3046882.1 DNA polymerase-3 subunit chi [Litorivivens lipolytica]
MTQVDFYILQSAQPQDALLYGCRLAEKAHKRGMSIYLHCADEAQGRMVDDLLWSFSPQSFVPHALKSAGTDDSMVIAWDKEAPQGGDLFINFAPEIPDFFSRFARLGEIVCQANDWLAPSRDRYRFYKDRGYPLNTHKIA